PSRPDTPTCKNEVRTSSFGLHGVDVRGLVTSLGPPFGASDSDGWPVGGNVPAALCAAEARPDEARGPRLSVLAWQGINNAEMPSAASKDMKRSRLDLRLPVVQLP